MPRLNIIFIFALCLCLQSCLDKKANNKHGLRTSPISQFTYRGVVERTIDLSFSVDKAEVTQITARIETEYDYDYPLNFQWRLGQDVVAIAGSELKGEIAHLRKNAPLEFSIAVKGFNTDQMRFVKFEIIGSNPTKRVFADGLVSSKPEKSFEKIVQEIETYKKAKQ